MEEKSCASCGNARAYPQSFSYRHHKKTTVGAKCADCRREHKRQRRSSWLCSEKTQKAAYNKDYYRAYKQKWIVYYARSRRNREAHLAQQRRYYALNTEFVKQHVAAYKKANPLKRQEWTSRRRSVVQLATSGRVDFAAVLQAHGRVCYLCGSQIQGKLTFDHVMPLSRGGAHSNANLRPACGPCNSRKHALTIEEYRQRYG